MSDPSTTTQEAEPSPRWADRGWYLALEYGVLARDRFLKRLPVLRALGRFQELLEPGGKIRYRNLFRAAQVKQAWEALTTLQPWKESVTCYLRGHEVPLREVHEVLWCAGFVREDAVCRGGLGDRDARKAVRFVGCPGAQIRLSSGAWDLDTPERRHVVAFGGVSERGEFDFDRAAIAEFVAGRGRGRLCPASPAADPQAFAEAFSATPVRALGWTLSAELGDPLLASLGESLSAEQGLALPKGAAEPPLNSELELRCRGGEFEVALLAEERILEATLRLDPAVEETLRGGTRLRAVLVGEGYVRRDDGHYDHELRCLIARRVNLGPADRVETFPGYRFETFPRATPQYEAWAERVAASLGAPPAIDEHRASASEVDASEEDAREEDK